MMQPDPLARIFRCLQCDQVSQDTLPRDLYSCGTCGVTFVRSDSADGVSTRCPECRHFAKRIDDKTCPHCRGGELAEIIVRICMLCDRPHDDARIPVECGGDGEQKPAVCVLKKPPRGSAADALLLPAEMAIRDVAHWTETNGTVITKWRLTPRTPRQLGDCIITAKQQPAEAEPLAELTCAYCGLRQHGTMSNVLTRLARGAHRHGARGVRIIAADERIPGPPY